MFCRSFVETSELCREFLSTKHLPLKNNGGSEVVNKKIKQILLRNSCQFTTASQNKQKTRIMARKAKDWNMEEIKGEELLLKLKDLF